MTKKHNVKHLRSMSSYGVKLREGRVDGRLSDPRLSDGKPSSAKR